MAQFGERLEAIDVAAQEGLNRRAARREAYAPFVLQMYRMKKQHDMQWQMWGMRQEYRAKIALGQVQQEQAGQRMQYAEQLRRGSAVFGAQLEEGLKGAERERQQQEMQGLGLEAGTYQGLRLKLDALGEQRQRINMNRAFLEEGQEEEFLGALRTEYKKIMPDYADLFEKAKTADQFGVAVGTALEDMKRKNPKQMAVTAAEIKDQKESLVRIAKGQAAFGREPTEDEQAKAQAILKSMGIAWELWD